MLCGSSNVVKLGLLVSSGTGSPNVLLLRYPSPSECEHTNLLFQIWCMMGVNDDGNLTGSLKSNQLAFCEKSNLIGIMDLECYFGEIPSLRAEVSRVVFKYGMLIPYTA